jgi:hypothetical protein
MAQLSVGYISSNVDLDLDNWDGYNFFVIDATSGSITISMETIVGDGMNFYCQRIDTSANTVTFTPKAGQTVNGGSSYSLPVGTRVFCVSSNSNFLIA